MPPPDWENAPRPQRSANQQREISTATLELFSAGNPWHPYFCIWNTDGSIQRKSDSCPPDLAKPAEIRELGSSSQRSSGFRRESFLRTRYGTCILVGIDLADALAGQRRFAWSVTAGCLIVLLVGTTLCWVLVSKMLRPVSLISRTAHAMASGELSARIPEQAGHGELDQLSRELNRSFAALEDAFQRQKSFTADASHELRTPLAIIISESQATLAQPRESREYKEALEYCLTSAQQMRTLIEAMLELARIDAVPDEPSKLHPVRLEDLAELCLDRLRPQIASAGLGLVCDLQPAAALGMELRIQQVITNLLTNAIAYNRPGGEIRLICRATGDWAELSVADTGIGIPEESLPKVFDRFWRADKARSRAQGHHGLGLSICKAIAHSQNGKLEVWSKVGVGSCFTLRLPLLRLPDNPEMETSKESE